MPRGNQNYDRIISICNNLLTGAYNVKKELFLFKKLYKKYPDFEFWAKFKSVKITNSLAWFLSEWGDPEVRRDWNNYLKARIKKEEVEFSLDIEENSSEQKVAEKKKSLIDILG